MGRPARLRQLTTLKFTDIVKPRSRPRRDFPLLLAHALRGGKFKLPQVLLVGTQVTQGPGLVRVLRVGSLAVHDHRLRAALSELSERQVRDIRAFIWSPPREGATFEAYQADFVALWEAVERQYPRGLPSWVSVCSV